MRFDGALFWFEIFITKQCVEFSLIFFGTAKKNCVIKTREIFSFLSLINNSVTIGLSFLLLIISAIISSNTINIFSFYLDCVFQYFYGYHPYHLSFE